MSKNAKQILIGAILFVILISIFVWLTIHLEWTSLSDIRNSIENTRLK